MKIRDDFEMIVHKLDRSLEEIRIYPLGDVHVGSREFSLELWNKWKKMVMDDENGFVVLVGDLMDNALRNSKTNIFEATMMPHEQKEWLVTELKPMKDKIIGAVAGNHEYRSMLESGSCPMYDILCKLDLEDLYRPNMAFMKINLGEKNKERQFSYTFVLAHGASRGKVDKFGYAIDGMDVMITGHTHSAESPFPAKIVMDAHNEQVRLVGFTRIVVPSFAKMGGYALKGMYMPQDSGKIPVVILSGKEKKVQVLWT